jgi:hypothetical protein
MVHLEYFKQNGYDLREQIGSHIYAEILRAGYMFNRSPEAYKELETDYFFQGDQLTQDVLFIQSISSSPKEIEEIITKLKASFDTPINLDWIIGLWSVCDNIPELYRLRRHYKADIEIKAKQVIDNLSKWEDLGVF